MKIFVFLFLGAALAMMPGTAVWAAEPGVVTEQRVNVRGQASLTGEVITQLQRGDKVTVLERVTRENAKAGEPANWLKIKLPENTPAWVSAGFIKNGLVDSARLNLRAGPGENYSVIGRLAKGAAVKAIRTVEGWIEIEAPADAYAFLDASLVKVESAATSVAPAAATVVTSPKPAAVPNNTTAVKPATTATPSTTVITPPAIPVPQPVAGSAAPSSNLQSATVANGPSASAPAPAASTPPAAIPLPPVAAPAPQRAEAAPGRRIVTREGIIRATRSIQAPTWYELVHPETKATMNFLLEERLGIKLKEFKGKRVTLTGEESIDARWPNTPILDIDSLDFAP